jgi:hypothetical protein
MSFRKLLTPVLTATLTCLIVLSVPNGQAEVLPDFSGGLASPTTTNSSPAEQLNVGGAPPESMAFCYRDTYHRLTRAVTGNKG